MRTVADFRSGARWMVLLSLVVGCAVAAVPVTASAQPADDPDAAASDEATVESLFIDFLHYARLGRFTAADAFAKALLERPDLDPVEVLSAANKDERGRQTLLILIQNSTIGDRAQAMLDLILQGEFELRKDADRIRANIAKLGGDPQQEYYAIRHLADSGEYAIPHMIDALLDPSMQKIRARIVNALPQIGKGAVNPLVMALRVADDDVRLHVIHALGEIGYPQAYPYLSKVIAGANMPPASKEAARRAIERIGAISGRPIEGSDHDQFFALAEKYYNDDDSVRADTTLPQANVWYWDGDARTVVATPVPVRLFGPIMAMRACEEALLLQPDKIDASALWLAANIRRESRLGMDVESGDPDEVGEPDPTRPDVFPRALYFTQAAGPRYAHLVLQRAVEDNESAVALGAIEALRLTAGEASLIGTEDYKQPLVEALQFPDLLVRTRAALALGAALPKSQFAGSQNVVPVLAAALTQTGRPHILVVDGDEENLNRVMNALRATGANAIGEKNFFVGMNRARVEFPSLSAVYVASDITEPTLATAVADFRGEFVNSKTPVIILTKPNDTLVADQITARDSYAATAHAGADEEMLTARLEEIQATTGQKAFDEDLALSIALQSAETLRMIAVDGRTVFAFEIAEPALISVLTSPSEELQIKAARVLALARTETAQRAVAHLALDDANTDSLRVATFNALAESAKNNGNLLTDDQVARLVLIAKDDENLVIRTAASEALGAVNLKSSKASEIVRKYYGG